MTRAEAASRRRVLWLLLAGLLGVIAVAALTWTGVRALLLSSELGAAIGDSAQLQEQLAASDMPAAEKSAERLRVHARAAAELSDEPVWRAVEFVPVIGDNLRAVRVVSSQLDRLSVEVIAPALTLTEDLASVWSSDGLDLDVLMRASMHLDHAVEVVDEAQQELEAVDSWALVGRVRQGLEQFAGYLTRVEPLLRDGARSARALPAMLGQDGPRSILVMLENGAELRTGGGLTGTFAEFRADHGSLELVDLATSGDFPRLDQPISALPPSVTSLLGDTVGRSVTNISSPAQFDVSANLASQWWLTRTGRSPDTIVSVDVPTIGALLAVIGPVDLGGWGELTSDNLVDRLLVQPYMTLDATQQDDLFQSAVRAVFTAALGTDIDPTALIAKLSTPIAEGRVSVWSTDRVVQSAVEGTAFAGPHARHRATEGDAFAVYLNDVTGAKMDSFLGVALQSGYRQCGVDGLRGDIAIAVTLTNTAPVDAGTTFPPSMTGGGGSGVPPGDIATEVAVAAPPGTVLGGVTQDQEVFPYATGDISGYPVTQSRVQLTPGQSTTLEFRFVASEPGFVDLHVLSTPLITPAEISERAIECSDLPG